MLRVRSPAHLDSRNPLADAAHDLVPDRSEPIGPVLDANVLVALLADQHGVVTDGDIGISDVDHQLIHRDDADDRMPMPTDQDLGTRPVRVRWMFS